MVRVVTKLVSGIIETYPDREHECFFKGALGDAVNYHVYGLKNCTFNPIDNDGTSFGNGSYSGGLGMLQKGTADLITLIVDYPLHGENFTYGLPTYVDRIAIGSAYDSRTKQESRDVFDMIHTFSPLQWLYVAISLLVFYLVLKYGQKIVKKVKNPDAGWIIMSVTMSFFTFFLLNFMMKSMNTDLVTVEDPKTIVNYDDIIRYKVKAGLLEGHIVIDYLKEAEAGTADARIWSYINKDPDGMSWMVERDPAELPKKLKQLLRQEIVFLSRAADTQTAMMFACSFMRDPDNDLGGHPVYDPDVFTIVSSDEGTLVRLASAVWSSLADAEFKRKMRKRTISFNEAGLIQYISDTYTWSLVERKPSIEECLSRTIQKKTPDTPNIKLKYTRKLFVFFFAGLGFAAVVLLKEMSCSRLKRPEKHKRSKEVFRRRGAWDYGYGSVFLEPFSTDHPTEVEPNHERTRRPSFLGLPETDINSVIHNLETASEPPVQMSNTKSVVTEADVHPFSISQPNSLEEIPVAQVKHSVMETHVHELQEKYVKRNHGRKWREVTDDDCIEVISSEVAEPQPSTSKSVGRNKVTPMTATKSKAIDTNRNDSNKSLSNARKLYQNVQINRKY